MFRIEVSGEIYKNKYIDMNTYIIDYKGECYIVDPGYEKHKIQAVVEANNLKVNGIILTHSHLDHISAIDVFNVPIYLYEKEFDLFMYNYNDLYNEREIVRPYNIDGREIIKLKDGDTLPLGDKKITFISTPGHTAGGVCYIFENDMYSGDTLFKGAVGRSDLKTGDPLAIKASIVNLINSQPENLNVHPAHGQSTTIGFEKKFNPYYNMWK
ncbi:MAG: MBL fold metallo-hydrolase [Sarcina sp.]